MRVINLCMMTPLLLLALSANAVPERHVSAMITTMVTADWQESSNHLGRKCASPAQGMNLHGMVYKVCDFDTRQGLTENSPTAKIRYTRFSLNRGNNVGEKGALVIAPGRAESSLKYTEVAYDFIQRGYSPVYAIDHRSQGFSSRSQENSNKVHSADFNNYVIDFKDFVEKVVQTDPAVKGSLFLISNSMGGAITAKYLEDFQNHPFKATAMFGAMHKIEFPAPYTEFLAKLTSNVVCSGATFGFFDCDDYAPGRGRDFDEEDRIFEDNPLTHSRNRYEMRNEMWRKRPWMATGGITFGWIQSATNIARSIRRNADKINIPMLVVTASQDPIVDPQGHREVCLNAPKCIRYEARGSRYEVLMESDGIRNAWMGENGILFDFLENPAGYVR